MHGAPTKLWVTRRGRMHATRFSRRLPATALERLGMPSLYEALDNPANIHARFAWSLAYFMKRLCSRSEPMVVSGPCPG